MRFPWPNIRHSGVGSASSAVDYVITRDATRIAPMHGKSAATRLFRLDWPNWVLSQHLAHHFLGGEIGPPYLHVDLKRVAVCYP